MPADDNTQYLCSGKAKNISTDFILNRNLLNNAPPVLQQKEKFMYLTLVAKRMMLKRNFGE